jgi:antitoxin (DNA-binding transcriptional repressor) of toxin-antitoxin stability system
MKSISIRELHSRTGHWVRQAAELGELQITDDGKPVAKLLPTDAPREIPYFAGRKVSPEFERLEKAGKLRGGRDSTIGISEDREDRYV